MPKKLPKGWIRTTLGEVCLPVHSIAPQDWPNAEFTYFDIGGIDNETNRIIETSTVIGRNAPSRARQLVQKGDILFSTVRTYLRKIARIDRVYPHAVASTGFTVLRPAEGVSSEFLLYQILTDEFLEPLHQLQTGTSYPAVRESDVLAQPILLPPTREQDRILQKLKASFGPARRAIAKTHDARERLQDYRLAVLQQAVTGEMTKEWRKAQRRQADGQVETAKALLAQLKIRRRVSWEKLELHRLTVSGKIPKNDKWMDKYPEPVKPATERPASLPRNWAWGSVDQVTTRVTVGYVGPMKAEYVASGVPFLRSQNVRANRFDPRGLLFIGKGFHNKLIKSRVVADDVVVVRSGAVGTTCVIPKTLVEANCSDLVVLQRPLVEPAYIGYYLNSAAQKYVQAGKVGIALTHFNTASVAALGIAVPPVAEQSEIVIRVQKRLAAADTLERRLEKQLNSARAASVSISRKAFNGQLVRQDPKDEPASLLLKRIESDVIEARAKQDEVLRESRAARKKRGSLMKESSPSQESLDKAWSRIRREGRKPDTRRLFDEAGYLPEQVIQFYEALRASPTVREAFEKAVREKTSVQKPTGMIEAQTTRQGVRFRLVALWLEDFKNLKDYRVFFNPAQGLDVILGWNGTGKSNLFEALVIIFRDLHGWWEKNRWPEKPLAGFRLSYEIDEEIVEVTWLPATMRRPEIKSRPVTRNAKDDAPFRPIKREQLPLPRFVFGYYSGPTNRLAEHFLPMKQAHYERLRKARADDTTTLASLLEQRRFFCAETHHAKYVLLAFSYKEDSKIDAFLNDRLRILGFESALFIIRKPRWAKSGSKAETFWGATGIMRRVMERLRRHSIAPMVLKQKVSYGYRATTEDHYYFFLPDLKSLHSFAAEYENARSFFLALESTDFSELIYDVKIQVRVKASDTEQVSITFHQLSEGEQQLLMVLGLMRFTKSHQSLVLLDEPDTHLNPHWSIDYLKDLARVMSDNAVESSEQQSSQILMATHDPLVIASLIKEQVHLLKRDLETGICKWFPASVNPRGLGFTGILTSEMFGFRSDLDPETLADLDDRVRLVAKEQSLTEKEKLELKKIDERLSEAGFSKAFSDPYYAAFVRAWGRRHSELMAGLLFITEEKKREVDQIAEEVLREAIAEVEKGISSE